jgi:hypothetical protein
MLGMLGVVTPSAFVKPHDNGVAPPPEPDSVFSLDSERGGFRECPVASQGC